MLEHPWKNVGAHISKRIPLRIDSICFSVTTTSWTFDPYPLCPHGIMAKLAPNILERDLTDFWSMKTL